jgi:acyl carrier protein
LNNSNERWSKAQIEQKVRELAAKEANVPAGEVELESHFVDDLNYDSLMEIELVMKVEDTFSIQFPESQGERKPAVPRSVGELAEVVEYKLRQQALPDDDRV